MKKTTAVLAFCLTPWLCLQAAALVFNLQPPPCELSLGETLRPLSEPVRIVHPAPPLPVMEGTSELLVTDLALRLGIEAGVFTPETLGAMETGVLIRLADGRAELPPEGYRVRLTHEDAVVVFTVEGNGRGILYGAMMLFDILEQASRAHGGFAAPEFVLVSGAPVIRHRVVPALGYPPERIARTRMNARQWGFEHGNDDQLDPTVRAAERFGLEIHARLGYRFYSMRKLGEPICPTNPEHMARIEAHWRHAGESGAKGFVFMFDDITPANQLFHVIRCETCREAFDGNLGRLQQRLLKQMVTIGREYGVDAFHATPAPYHKDWREFIRYHGRDTDIFDNYFSEFIGDPLLADVVVSTCDFRREVFEELREFGIRNLRYGMNGLWSSQAFFTHYTGMDRLAWAWYAWEVGEHGPQPSPQAMAYLRNLHEHVSVVGIGTGNVPGLQQGAIWLWNPPAYDEERVRAYVSDYYYGFGVYEHLAAYEEAIMPLVHHFGTFISWRGDVGGVACAENLGFPLQQEWLDEATLAGLQAHVKQARAAHQALLALPLPEARMDWKAGTAWAPTAHHRSRDGDGVADAIDYFDQAVAHFTELLRLRRVDAIEPTVTPEPDETVVGWWRFDAEDPTADHSSHGNTLTLHGSPATVAGINGDGLKFRGGREFRLNAERGRSDYARAPSSESLNMGAGQDFTVEFWLDLGQADFDLYVGKRGTALPLRQQGWAVGYIYGNLCFVTDDGETRNEVTVPFGEAIMDRHWNHIVAVRDAGVGELRLYVNGREAARADDETDDLSNTRPVQIGWDSSHNIFLNGILDEVKITRAVVPAGDIARQYRDYRTRGIELQPR